MSIGNCSGGTRLVSSIRIVVLRAGFTESLRTSLYRLPGAFGDLRSMFEANSAWMK